MPIVSICLPVYNGSRFLAEAIESALAQTFHDFELIIVDDRSTDDSLKIAHEYAQRDKRVQVFQNEKNLGLFANYNQCLKKSSGKYIKLFAQDDLLAPQMLARVLEAFAANDTIALVSTARLTIDDTGSVQRSLEQLDSSRIIPGDDVIKDCLFRFSNWIGEPSTVMFPARHMGSGFDTSFYHLGDLEYWCRIIAGGSYVFLNEPLSSFRKHGGSATSRNLRSLLFAVDMLRLGRLFQKHLQDAGLDDEEYLRRATEFSAFFVHHLVTNEGLTAEASLSVDLGAADQAVLLKQFRELAFHALYFAADSISHAQSVRAELDQERFDTEQQLRTVLNSRSWRMARSLSGIARPGQSLRQLVRR